MCVSLPLSLAVCDSSIPAPESVTRILLFLNCSHLFCCLLLQKETRRPTVRAVLCSFVIFCCVQCDEDQCKAAAISVYVCLSVCCFIFRIGIAAVEATAAPGCFAARFATSLVVLFWTVFRSTPSRTCYLARSTARPALTSRFWKSWLTHDNRTLVASSCNWHRLFRLRSSAAALPLYICVCVTALALAFVVTHSHSLLSLFSVALIDVSVSLSVMMNQFAQCRACGRSLSVNVSTIWWLN